MFALFFKYKLFHLLKDSFVSPISFPQLAGWWSRIGICNCDGPVDSPPHRFAQPCLPKGQELPLPRDKCRFVCSEAGVCWTTHLSLLLGEADRCFSQAQNSSIYHTVFPFCGTRWLKSSTANTSRNHCYFQKRYRGRQSCRRFKMIPFQSSSLPRSPPITLGRLHLSLLVGE